MTEARRRFLKQIGINDVSICFDPGSLSYDGILETADLVRSWGFNITDADCGAGPKNDSTLLYGGEREQDFLDTYELFKLFEQKFLTFSDHARPAYYHCIRLCKRMHAIPAVQIPSAGRTQISAYYSSLRAKMKWRFSIIS